MRKFKLRDQVVRKMKGIENTAAPVTPALPREKETAAEPETREKPADSLRVIHRTDIGLIRKSNQDAVIVGNGLMGVADGMGGHRGGETASAGARDGMLREAAARTPSPSQLEEAIREVNLELWEMQLKETDLSGMGTTLTVLWPEDENMLIGHVGDSRAYLLRDGEMRQITKDHSMVADMVRRGMLTEEQAACHPMRNYITRAVGTESDVQADIEVVPRQKGDRWLVCSDGLHGAVDKSRLQELMRLEDPDEAADQMIREALDQGGRDNITLVIAVDEAGGGSTPADAQHGEKTDSAPAGSTDETDSSAAPDTVDAITEGLAK